mgnify:CR=1 FL=1
MRVNLIEVLSPVYLEGQSGSGKVDETPDRQRYRDKDLLSYSAAYAGLLQILRISDGGYERVRKRGPGDFLHSDISRNDAGSERIHS